MLHFQGKIKSIPLPSILDGDFFNQLQSKLRSVKGLEFLSKTGDSIFSVLEKIKSLGAELSMDDYEKKKLGIFNQLNFFQCLFGFLIPIAGIAGGGKPSIMAWVVASLPAFISLAVLWLNKQGRREAALVGYFLFYPIITSIVYMSGMNLGVELFFILYGILSVFFVQDLSQMLFSVSLSMISYFMLSVAWKNYSYQLETANLGLYLFNQLLAIVFIFYGLYLIKKENTEYQLRILNKNRDLHVKNIEIQTQKKEIAATASLLQVQTDELTELNTVKNKLFSIIAHDLKSPMYALRNLFKHMQQYDLPADEIKTMVPDVLHDLNYTTGLMENLLHWAKCQMNADSVNKHLLSVNGIIDDVLQLVQSQANSKNIKLHTVLETEGTIYADEDMVNLVLRNLMTNAIKFTPANGTITIGIEPGTEMTRIFVRDTGTGISAEELEKINENSYYSTKGTDSESGTGLGLMLVKEFLIKNGGYLKIESTQGKGSEFSCYLPAEHTES